MAILGNPMLMGAADPATNFTITTSETTTDFNVLASPKGWWFEHLIGNQKGLRICPFGRVAIFVFIFIIIIRNYIEISQFFMNIVFFFLYSLGSVN